SDSFTYTATNPAGTSAPATVTITITPPVPEITGITPSAGTSEGGEPITISGSGLTGATGVTIGGYAATNVIVVNDTAITVVTPATIAGSHDVVVSTPSGPLTLAAAFTSASSVSAPLPAAISPTSGSTTGGTLVTITGAGFSNATGVYFDGVPAAGFTIHTDGRITSTTPAHAAGLIGFEITSAGGDGGITDSYTYVAPVISFTPAAGALIAAQAAVSYSQTFSASGAAAPYAFAITGGALPAGLDLSSEGVLEGTPTEIGNAAFTITVTDANGVQDNATYNLSVGAPSIALDPSTLSGGTYGDAYTHSFVASGGNAPYSYSVTPNALPAGMSLSSDGTLSGTPTVVGIFNFTVTASDSTTGSGAPFSTTQAYRLTINNVAPIAGDRSVAINANSADNVITLSLSGGAATSVAVATQATKGVATASGTAITYTPNPGYSGVDSFSYTATNDAGTSASATVT
ncbi:putative Ig domain-containing protein, partial [Agrobacterium bohemicum]|uniref:putative Ig domain-containing protein n=1 Tax=Agrobacterium bohemicum TaxID=2052828 RepID=UPI000AB194AB